MVGTLLLFSYWPSFNSARIDDDINKLTKAYVATLLSLVASCLTAVYTCRILRKGKLDMMVMLTATLSGGVIIGACTEELPGTAVLLGSVAGLISSVG